MPILSQNSRIVLAYTPMNTLPTWITNFDLHASISVIRSCTKNTRRSSVKAPTCFSYPLSQFKLTTQFRPCHRRTTVSVRDTARCGRHMLMFSNWRRRYDRFLQNVQTHPSNSIATTRWKTAPLEVPCRIIAWHRISTRQASWPVPTSSTFLEYSY